MKIIEVLTKNGIEREEIEIDVPSSPELVVRVTLRTIARPVINADAAERAGFGRGSDAIERLRKFHADNGNGAITDEMTKNIERSVWDNMIAALATQKARR